MTKINFTQLKIINLFLFFIFLLGSCGSTKNIISDKERLILCLNDFIKVYKTSMVDSELKAILIYCESNDGKIIYKISDVPKNVIFGAINDLKRVNTASFIIGKFEGIPVQLYDKKPSTYSDIFENIDQLTIDKAQSAAILKDEKGKTYIIDLSLSNWEAELEIIYDVFKNKKEIRFIGNEHKSEMKKIY